MSHSNPPAPLKKGGIIVDLTIKIGIDVLLCGVLVVFCSILQAKYTKNFETHRNSPSYMFLLIIDFYVLEVI